MTSERIKSHTKAQKELKDVFEQARSTLVIHYSCESFYDRPEGRSPRITSIAVRNLDSAQTESFSIHKMAERRHVPFEAIEARYDELERDMLNEFFEYVRLYMNCHWLHWNMRDANYGFHAIEHRYQVLGGNPPTSIPDERKHDLSRILIGVYGTKYISHPRLLRLMECNNITHKDFMTGEQEATAFEKKNYVALHQSTLRKVDILANIATRAYEGRLKTNARWWEATGMSPSGIWEGVKDHWVLGTLALIAAITGILAFFGLAAR